MLGESFDANAALQYGLINDVIAADDIFDFSLNQAKKLAAQPPISLQATKQLMAYNKEAIRAQMKKELLEFGARLASDEAKARFAAFLER